MLSKGHINLQDIILKLWVFPSLLPHEARLVTFPAWTTGTGSALGIKAIVER